MSQNKTCTHLWPLVAACLVSVSLSIGCGGDPNMGDVRGVVTLDGKPLPGAFVQYNPQADDVGAPSFGKTDANGKYHMMFSDSKSGVFIGSNKVEIRTGDVKPDNSGAIPEVVPTNYNDETTLVAEVKAGKNTFDWELKSNASSTKQVKGDFAPEDE